jgi:hypothetical protein
MNLKCFFRQMDITIINTVLTVLFFGSLCLTIWEIEIYHKTFIPVYIPVLLWIIPGLLSTPFLVKFLKDNYNIKSIFLQLFYNIVTWGGLMVFTFMTSNYFLAEKDIITKSVNIIETGHLAKGRYGCGESYVEIKYKGHLKQLIYPCDTDLENKIMVEIKIKKGKWGFDIITSQIAN